MPGFHVEHFGCRAARADGEAVSDRLRAAGLGERQFSAADVVVVNTCSVTAEADRAARTFIRRAHRLNPAARIVVTGCSAQRAPQELAGMAGVAAVVGNSHKALAPEIILGLLGRAALHEGNGLIQLQTATNIERAISEQLAPPQVVWADDRFAHSFLEETQIVPGAQTRPNLKIQEGCGNRCAFCIIPQTRGPSHSLPAASVLKQVEGFVAAGGNELVLSGINLGRWGRDLAGSLDAGEASASHPPLAGLTLAGLVRRILEQTRLPRLRLSSIEPMDWDAELIGLMAEFASPQAGGARLARHAHLPLQSGSDPILRRMHRRYRPWHYADRIERIRRAMPDAAIGADVMVGFPGETDDDFEQTRSLIERLPFTYLHVFTYSSRPGTPSAKMQDQVAVHIARERNRVLRELAAQKKRSFMQSFVGRELEAITLTHYDGEFTEALADNYLKLRVRGEHRPNTLLRSKIEAVESDTLLGSSPM